MLKRPEAFFLSEVKAGHLRVYEDGSVYNNQTDRWIGAIGSGKYPKISKKNMETGRIEHIQIHRLVWLVYKGPIPKGFIVDHEDDDKANPALNNLNLTTLKGNHANAVIAGKIRGRPGADNPNAKFTQEDIDLIRELQTAGWKQVDLATHFETNRQTIAAIVNRTRYK